MGPRDAARRRAAQQFGGARLVKGSHIVVPRLYDGEEAYILQNDDRRIVFVLPFERDFTLIGTTELPFTGDPGDVQISPEEIDYLCRAVARWFRAGPSPADVVWCYAGVRPLYDDHAANAAAATRDYVLELDAAGGAPALSVFGGKVTTHRRLAEHALARLGPWLKDAGPPWTAGSVLPGGEGMPAGGPAALAAELRRDYPFLADARTASPAPTAPRRAPSSARRRAWPIWDTISAAASTSARCAGWWSGNGRRPPTTSCGAARSSGCARTLRRCGSCPAI